jgi:hypothetical protein
VRGRRAPRQSDRGLRAADHAYPMDGAIGAARLPRVNGIAQAFRSRLVPALLTALGVALLAYGLMTYTTAVEPAPSEVALATYDPLPSVPPTVTLPDGAAAGPGESFPPGRVATRVVIRRLRIDLPVMLQEGKQYGIYPLCDVAMYLPYMGQPGQGRATYLYAHAQPGMFWPLLVASTHNNGARLKGMTVEVYTSDDWLFLYEIKEVRRHTLSLDDAVNSDTERLWLQTSEGPAGTREKLQVIADFVTAERASPKDAHPPAAPRICGGIQ